MWGDVGGKPGGDAVVEEGEAKILMDSANGVFYDEAQVMILVRVRFSEMRKTIW